MKNLILKVSVVGLAVAMGSSIGCNGCGTPSTQNPVNNGMLSQGSSMTCGSGTTLINTANGPQCVASSSVGSH